MKLRRILPVLVALLVAGGGTALAVNETTGTVVACASVTVPSGVVAFDGSPVYTTPSESQSQCETTSYTVPTVTTTTTTSVTGSPMSSLFDDEFTGAAGAAPDPTRWNDVNGLELGNMSCSKAANAFLDGQGHLVLRVTREAAGWCPQDAAPFAGADVGTYAYQSGWPPRGVTTSWPTGFEYEARFRCAPVAGAWEGPGWLQSIDRTTSQGLWEVDAGETRTTFPTTIGANQHKWAGGSDVSPENGGATAGDCRTSWHTVDVDVLAAGGTRYYLDGVYVATHSGVGGAFGVQLHNEIADVGSWGSGGAQPAASDPGPWDMLVDYVRVRPMP